MYREHPSRIAGAVAWTSIAEHDSDADVRVLPDGCIDLIWNGTELLIAGPDTHAHLFSHERGTQLSAVRFAPGFGPRVVGVPACELTDQRLVADELWGRAEVERLYDALHAAPDPVTLIEEVALDRSTPISHPDQVIEHVVTMARRGDGVAAIANEVGLSNRQLHRRCLDAFGYGAKTLSRILRLTRALALARTGRPFADTAIASGYSDQAHLSRDVKQLTGVTLGQLAE